MKVYELKTLICAECGVELHLRRVLNNGTIKFTHPGVINCSNSEKVCIVPVGKAIKAEVIGKEDWKTLPEKVVPCR